MREEGHYWVKKYDFSEWAIAYYTPLDYTYYTWRILGSDDTFMDTQLFQINETRILPPQN